MLRRDMRYCILLVMIFVLEEIHRRRAWHLSFDSPTGEGYYPAGHGSC